MKQTGGYFILTIIVQFIFCSCEDKTANKAQDKNAVAIETITTQKHPEEFEAFYAQLKSVPDFQHERVIYPLKGERIETSDTGEACCEGIYYWTEKDSLDFGATIYTTEFKIELKHHSPIEVEEWIYIPNSGVSIKTIYRRKQDGKWYIDYFSSVFI